ncbi:hypothetical protein CLV58_109152 [Spirosoma oryzae]|uniref:Uncharacterized protein n=1 Tax=Spirosoma oryzae TaxID=1469603 RepID=A0A2T0SYE0_9BACT|nr:hypothetical protein [Spirosoma oryzae]PRY38425.1 hypothetical protein CLV58_109152 [Spirosoma oryzae]
MTDIKDSEFYQELTLTDAERAAFSDTLDFKLEDIPLSFSGPQELKAFVNGMVFFTDNLHPVAYRMNALNPMTTPAPVMLRFNQELLVINKLLTMHRYELNPDHTKAWYKGKITDPNPTYLNDTEAILGIIPMGVHLSPAEWDLYKGVFDELFELHQEKLAAPVLGPTEEQLTNLN